MLAEVRLAEASPLPITFYDITAMESAQVSRHLQPELKHENAIAHHAHLPKIDRRSGHRSQSRLYRQCVHNFIQAEIILRHPLWGPYVQTVKGYSLQFEYRRESKTRHH